MLSLCLDPTTVQYVILTRQMIIVGASLSEIRVWKCCNFQGFIVVLRLVKSRETMHLAPVGPAGSP